MVVGERCSFVVILPDGTESHYDGHLDKDNSRRNELRLQSIADDAVRKAGLTSPYVYGEAPARTPVRICSLTIVKGQLVRSHGSIFQAATPMARMTDEDYELALAKKLEGLPEEFANWVSQEAYEDGHSAGREEVVLLAGNMAYGLKIAVEAYTKRITQRG